MRKRKLPRMKFLEPRRSKILQQQQQQRTRKRKRKRRKGKCYYSMSYLQEVRTSGSQLLVLGFYLHYRSCWFSYYWSDSALQHGPSYQRPTSSTDASRPTTSLQSTWTMHFRELHASHYSPKSSYLKFCIIHHDSTTSPTRHQPCLLQRD